MGLLGVRRNEFYIGCWYIYLGPDGLRQFESKIFFGEPEE